MAKKSRKHRRVSKRVLQHTPKRGTAVFVREDGINSIYNHLSGHFGHAACILLSVMVCQYVLSYNTNLDMDAKDVNMLWRLFSCSTMNLTAYNTVVLARQFVVARTSLSTVEMHAVHLLQKLGVITETGEMGLIDRIVHPQAYLKPNRSPAVIGAEVMSSLTIAGLALDYAADHTLLPWITMYTAFCIYGVLLLMEVSVFGFVRFKVSDPVSNLRIKGTPSPRRCRRDLHVSTTPSTRACFDTICFHAGRQAPQKQSRVLCAAGRRVDEAHSD